MCETYKSAISAVEENAVPFAPQEEMETQDIPETTSETDLPTASTATTAAAPATSQQQWM